MFLVRCIKAHLQLGNSHRFGHFLYDNLDKDSGRRCRLVFVEMNDIHDAPRHRICMKEMREQFCNIAQLVGLQSMNGIILLLKALHKGILPTIDQQTEARRNQPVVSQECTFLRTTFDQHIDELHFTTRRDFNASEFVGAFFKGRTGHDRQVDRSSQMD